MPLGTTKPRVLVVEDDAPIRSALEVSLRGAGYEVRAEDNGSAVELVVRQFRPDLAILDVRLPVGPDGYAIGRRLRHQSDIPILFLTAAYEVDARRAGFEAGADDYMVKPFSMDELLWRIRALLRRAGRLKSPVRQVGDLVVDEDARMALRANKPLELTRTEFELLNVLVEHPGQVLTKEQLLSRVWGFDVYDTNIVEVHVSALRRKLEANGPRLIHTVRGIGYTLRA